MQFNWHWISHLFQWIRGSVTSYAESYSKCTKPHSMLKWANICDSLFSECGYGLSDLGWPVNNMEQNMYEHLLSGQETLHLLRNLNVCCHVQSARCWTVVRLIQSQLTSCFHNIHLNCIILSMHRSSFRFSDQICVLIFICLHVCCMCHPSHSGFNRLNNIHWRLWTAISSTLFLFPFFKV